MRRLSTVLATTTTAALLSSALVTAAPTAVAGVADRRPPSSVGRVSVFGGEDPSIVRLGWSTPTRTGSRPVRTYEVRWRTGTIRVAAPTTQVAVTGLEVGTYVFRVRAVSRAGAGPWSKSPPAAIR